MPTGWIASARSPCTSKRDLVRDHVLDRIDHADRAADLRGHPHLRAVLLELGDARARIDQHVGHHLRVPQSMKCAMLVVSEVLTMV